MSAVAVYDPDLGPVEIIGFPAKDRKAWGKAENWGLWLAYPEDGAAHFHEVWMLNLNGRVRYVARGGKQYGPQHRSVVAATYWAFAHGWRDPFCSLEFNVRCIVEVRGGGAMDGPWRPEFPASGDHNKGGLPSLPVLPRRPDGVTPLAGKAQPGGAER